MTGDLGLRGAKDYGFYAAIAGVRNKSDLAPLIPPRGLPPHSATDPIRNLFDHLAVGWLTLAEINAALSHMNIGMETLSDQLLMVLDVMSVAERRLGVGRCRLVFGFIE